MQATMALPGAVPVPMLTGSIEAYIQTVNRFPILSIEEEQALARKFRDGQDLESARQPAHQQRINQFPLAGNGSERQYAVFRLHREAMGQRSLGLDDASELRLR